MKIKKIKLKNWFKRFQNLTIDLGENPSRIIALIWNNWSWKSSVFDWMTALNSIHRRLWTAWNKKMQFYSMEQNDWYRLDLSIDIDFDNWNFRQVYDTKTNSWKGNTLFSFRNSYRFNSNLDITSIAAIPDIKDNWYGASNSVDLDDRMTQNYQRLFIKYDKILNDENLRPMEAKKRVIWELNSFIKNCLDLEINNLWSIQDNKWRLFFKKDGHPQIFDFNVLSAWEKEVIDILLDLYLRKDEYNDTIYIIDEPELHLNTSIQKKLLIEINKIIPENCQIWIATHSIWFLRALQNELNQDSSIIYFDPEFKLASEVKTLEPIEKNRENWKKIFSTALDDIIWLLSPENIIYCEWSPEPDNEWNEQWFDAGVYNDIFKNEFPNYFFISSDWCSQVQNYSELALVVLKKAFIDVNIIKLVDKDNKTDEQRELFISEWGKMLQRYAIENYLLDKEIINKFCIQNWTTFDENFYNQQIPDIINPKLKNTIWPLMQKFSSIRDKGIFLKELWKLITSETKIYQELKEIIF